VAFQKFTQVGKSHRPRVSIRSNGLVRLNSGAVDRFSLAKVQFVTLLFDKDRKVLGIRPAEESEDGAMRLRKGKTSAYVGGRRFIEFFGIDANSDELRRLDPRWDDQHQMIVVDLP
jgi:hypothetical protein